MTLKLKVTADEFEGLDEGIKGLYEERDGEYALPVEGIEDTGGLKSALEKERKAARDASKRLKDYEGLGLSAEEIAQLKEAQRQAEEDKAKKSGEWEKLKGQMQEKHQQEIKAREEKVASMRKALESHLVDAQATSAISAAKGNAKLLLPHVKSAVQVIEEDGEYKVQVMGKDGPRSERQGRVSNHCRTRGRNEIVGRLRNGFRRIRSDWRRGSCFGRISPRQHGQIYHQR